MTDNVVIPFTGKFHGKRCKKKTRRKERVVEDLTVQYTLDIKKTLKEYDYSGMESVVIVGIPKDRRKKPEVDWSPLNDVDYAASCLLYAIQNIEDHVEYQDTETGNE